MLYEVITSQAITSYEKAIELGDRRPGTYDGLSFAYHASGENARALEAHETAMAINPNHQFSYKQLGDIYMALGRYEEARAAYDKAVQANDKKVHALTCVITSYSIHYTKLYEC